MSASRYTSEYEEEKGEEASRKAENVLLDDENDEQTEKDHREAELDEKDVEADSIIKRPLTTCPEAPSEEIDCSMRYDLLYHH